MKRTVIPWLAVAIVACFALASPDPGYSKRSGGSFGSSRSSASSGLNSSGRVNASGSRGSSGNPGGNGWYNPQSSSKQPALGSASMSAADRALAEKAKAAGTSFSSREDAVRAFRAKEGTNYSTNFDQEPSSRPSYVPQSTTVGGQNVVIVFSPEYRGYGYFSGGAWRPYSVWDDPYQADYLMRSRNYYYGGYGGGGFSMFWTFLILALLAFGAYHLFRFMKSRDRGHGMAAAGALGAAGTAGAAAGSSGKEAPVYDKDNPDFWRRMKPKSIVTLSDAQSLQDSMDEGKGPKPRDYVVKEIQSIKESSGLAEWLFFRLEGGSQPLWLMAKIVDRDMDVRIYFEAPGFAPGNRRDVLDAGMDWLFQPPPDRSDFGLNDLAYTTEISFTEESGKVVPFRRKPQGDLYGESTYLPKRSGIDKLLTAVVEYGAVSECDNPELVLIEAGDENSPEGGYIMLFQGCKANLTEVDVLNI